MQRHSVNRWRLLLARRRWRGNRVVGMARFRAVRPFLLLGLVGVMVLWEYSHAEHTAALRWMMGYTSAEGVGCCSERDCFPWPVALLQLTGDQATVRIGDTVVQLPAKSVHATQDGQTY